MQPHKIHAKDVKSTQTSSAESYNQRQSAVLTLPYLGWVGEVKAVGNRVYS
jgi:hypothetical protein